MFSFFRKTRAKKESPGIEKETWFVRVFDSDNFIQQKESPLDGNIIFLKDSLVDANEKKCFCPIHFKWENVISIDKSTVFTEKCNFSGNIQRYEACSKDGKDFYNSYFYESKLFNSVKKKEISLEELTDTELVRYLKEYRNYLEYKRIQEEHKEKQKSGTSKDFLISNKIHKDVLFYRIISDEEKLTLILEQYSINRAMLNHDFPFTNHQITKTPLLLTSEFYDVKNDKYEMLKNQGLKFAHNPYSVASMFYPEEVFNYCEKIIRMQTTVFIGRKIGFHEYACEHQNRNYYHERNNRKNETSFLGDKLKALVYFPYEPSLYFAIKTDSKIKIDEFLKSQKYRLDPNCYQNYCNSLGFSSYKTLRKLYYKNQNLLHVFPILNQMGFKDINIKNRILSQESADRLFLNYHNEINQDTLFFFQWAIPLRGEKSAWKLIEKGLVPEDDGSLPWHLYDTLRMFHMYFHELDEQTRHSILKDGLTKYNHDLLSNIGNNAKEKNVDFVYTAEEKALEDKINGYTFLLPKDYDELKKIGAALHNCVASYKYSILNKESLIVYAAKDGEYKLCIEVRKKVVHQQRANWNQTPEGDDADALFIWRGKHELLFYQNNY
ncbi:MAG: PcfJ domain-containing protein [Treponema sp.]|nr:PcfJ domain-containing protein [Treponema sp.]